MRAGALQESPRPQPTALKSQALAQTSERGTRSTALGKNQSCNLSPWAKQSSLNNICSVRDLSGHIFGHICPSRALLQDFSSESRAVSLGSSQVGFLKDVNGTPPNWPRKANKAIQHGKRCPNLVCI